MQSPAICVEPEFTIARFIDDILMVHRQTTFPVARDGRLHGILSLSRLRQVPKENWEQLIVRDVMEPIDDSLFVTVRASVEHARHKLAVNDLGFLAVIDQDGLLIGYLNAADLETAS
jgi:CBS domain-containing protein